MMERSSDFMGGQNLEMASSEVDGRTEKESGVGRQGEAAHTGPIPRHRKISSS